jgi:S1-C subfamily serine protease
MSVQAVQPERGGSGRPRSGPGRGVALVAGLVVGLLTGTGGPIDGAVPPEHTENLTAASRQVDPSVVDTITFADPAGTQILGTGIIVASTGLVLTDYHVIRDGVFIGVRVGGRGAVHPASVVISNPSDDLALLQIEGGGWVKPAVLGRASTARVGDAVLAIGNALGLDGALRAVSGRLVALRRAVSYGVGSSVVSLAGILEAATPVFAGDSGGALVDGQGRVIGVIAAGSDAAPCPRGAVCPLHLAYAIPIGQAMDQIGYGQGF